jgi:hypothetical protein
MLATQDFSDLNSLKNGNNNRQVISRGSHVTGPIKLDQTSIRSRLNIS